ncbi:MAG: DUF1269 domain-containing protein [Anaerolineaceae bacterium]|nr:MAG: DUF1269 domain-containing protein [Anaerolineaceae bacterium]
MSDQDKGQAAVYNIVAFNFDGQDTAKQTLKEAKKAGAFEGYDVVVEAVVEQDEKGKVHFHEPGHGVWGGAGGAVAGGLLGLIGGPAGLLAWTVGGAVVGGAAGKYLGRPIKKGDLKEIGEAMAPDSSAFLLLLEDKDTEDAVKSMSGYNANVVTLTVGDELSGQIASYVAGEATDDQGNVIAGAGGVAADSEGDVAAGGAVAAGTTGDDS